MSKQVSNVAFVVGVFPAMSETWLLSQITGLLDRGVEVDIFSLHEGAADNVSADYIRYGLKERTYQLDFPKSYLERLWRGMFLFIKVFLMNPRAALGAINIFVYGTEAASLKLLFRIAPFVGKTDRYDVVHCHFGTVANKFVPVKKILRLTQPHMVTFYGYDVSHVPQEKGQGVYGEVIKHFDRFLVMSQNMKKRILPLGFQKEKIIVHPISINVDSYQYKERALKEGESIHLTAVGRFVEKKGFDDLIRAIGLVKKEATQPFYLDLVGDGALRSDLEQLARNNDVTDVINFRGYMKLDDVKKVYDHTHLYLQPSKTAKDGDME